MLDKLTIESIFPINVYSIEKPEFLAIARTVALELCEKRHKEIELNETFPCYMTEAINADPRMLDFSNYVAQTAWNILNMQGYDVQNMATYFKEMWCQEHHKGSLMEQHIHNNNSQIVGFYFLDTPDDNSRAIFYDPKAGKVQINLPEQDITKVTPASNMISYYAKPGTLMFTNAWLPHSFSKNMADTPMRFIHFNVCVQNVVQQSYPSNAEVI